MTLEIKINLIKDNQGVPGESITEDKILINESFFVEILVGDIREQAKGIIGLALDIEWDAAVLEEIDSPFTPSNLITNSLLLNRQGILDNSQGLIDNLGGGAIPGANIGKEIGVNELERFALLKFRGDSLTADSIPLKVTIADPRQVAFGDGASFVSGTENIEQQTLSVVNPPILVSEIVSQNATEDTPFSFQFAENTFAADTVTDPNSSDSLSYSATLADGSALPTWLSFNPGTRTFSGTPTNDNVGNLNIKVFATDTAGATVSDNFTLTIENVNDVPTVTNLIADAVATEDTAFSFTIPVNTFSDVDTGDTLNYSATLADGSALPTWLSFNSGTRTFSGTPTNDNVGNLNVKVVATDTAGATVSDNFTLTIENVNDEPTVTNLIADAVATEDTAFSFTIPVNTFSDVDTGDTLNYSATLADDSALPTWLSFNPGTRTFSGTPTNDNVGNLNVKVVATDTAGATVSDNFTLTIENVNDVPTVTNLIADAVATEDTAFSFTIPVNTFSDVDTGDTLNYSATLADDSALPTWLSFNSGTRTFSGTPTNDNVGNLNVKVVATDTAGATVSDNFTLTIENVNDEPTVTKEIPDQKATETEAFNFQLAEDTFNDIDANDTLTFSATLADGNPLPGWLTFNPTNRTFSGTPNQDDLGNISIKVTATDKANVSVSDIFDISINDIPTIVNPIGNRQATEDTAFQLDVSGNFRNIVGQPLTFSAKDLPNGLTLDANSGLITGIPSNEAVGTTTVTITATDTNQASVSDTFALNVENVNDAPTLESAIANQTATEDSAFNFIIPDNTFNDVDALDELTYSVTLEDGSELPTWLTFDASTRSFSGTPSNGDVGTVNIKVVVTDKQGATVNDSFTLTVENVNDVPTLESAIANQTATEDAAFTFTIPQNTFNDIDAADELTYSVTLEDGSELPSWLTFDASTRSFSGTSSNSNVGTVNIKVIATDKQGATVNDSFTLTVENVNDVPTLESAIANQTATEDAAFTFTIPQNSFNDVDALDELTYSVTLEDGNALPSWLTFDASTRRFSGTPSNSNVGTVNIKVIATDKQGATVNDSFTLTVENVNDVPTLESAIANQTATEDAAFTFTIPQNTFNDIDAADELTYSVTLEDGNALPSWLTFDASTRRFSGTPSNSNVGTVNIKVVVTDKQGATVNDSFTLTVENVNDVPTLESAIANQTATEDAAFTFTIPQNTFNDIDAADELTYSVTLEDGNALPSWLTFDASTRRFSGTPSNSNVGTVNIKVVVTDKQGATVNDSFTLTVENVNDAPTLESAIANQTATEDSAFNFIIPDNTFNDVDALDELTYSVTLEDGSALPSWLTFDASTRRFSGTPSNSNVGTVNIKVVVTDKQGATVNDSFTLTVENVNDVPTLESAIANQIATEDSVFNFTIPENTFNDVDTGDELTYSVTLDSGSELPSWLTFDASTRRFSGTPSNSNVGTVNIKVVVTDKQGATVNDSFTLTVENVNDVPTLESAIANQTATEDSAFNFIIPENSFNDVDALDELTYSVTLEDGNALPSWLTFDASTRRFSGTPSNSNVGTVNIKVVVTDKQGATVNDSFTLTVENVNDVPTLESAIANQTVTEDSTFNFIIPENTFNDIDAADELTYSVTLEDGNALPSWLTFDASTRRFSGTPSNSNVGTVSIKVVATDSFGETVSDTFTLEVENTNDVPTLESAIANQTATEDSAFNFTIPENTFNDIDAADELTYSVTLEDGNALPSWLTFDASTRSFNGTPSNSNVGTVNIKVIATDKQGATVNDSFTLTVENVNDVPTLESAIANQTATEDSAFNFIIPDNTFNDVDALDELTYSVTLEDGSELPSWLTFDASTRSFNGTPSNSDVGTVNIKVIATDKQGATVNDSFTLTVENVNDVPTLESAIANQTATEDSAFNFIIPDNTFNDVDALDELTYSVTLEDGSELPSWLTFDASTRRFSGTPSNSNVGTVNIKVIATDKQGATVNDSFTLTVENVNDVPTATEIENQTAKANQPFSLDISSKFSDIDKDDILTFAATDLPDGLNIDSQTGIISGTISQDAVGTNNVTITATDKASASVSENFEFTVEQEVISDTDKDGITDDIEALKGDANKDGIPDNQQANVASSENITIISAPDTTLRDVTITTNGEPDNQGITFPVGVLDFKLEGLTPGAATTVNLLFAQDQPYNTFWKYGQTADNSQDHWYEFLYDGETGAQFFDTNDDGKADQIALHFVDGKRGDADLIANGVIVDPGAPGVTNTSLSLSKSTSTDIWNIEGDAGAVVAKFSLVGKNSDRVNEVGVFKVNADNKVNGIAAGEAGFAQAALQQGSVIFSALADNLLNGVDLSRKLQVGAGERLAFYNVSNGTTDGALNKNSFGNVFFSINEANANGKDYLQVKESNGIYTLNWEQGNDNSFNDLVMNFGLENTPLTTQNLIGNYQGKREGELINLESFTGREVKATFTLQREAAYNNFVGFYKVDDAQGSITDELTGKSLKPGDAGYNELVVKQRIPGVDLTVGNNQSVTIEDTLEGGSLFATFIIADANPGNINGDFSKVYTSYIAGNSDKVDHIRLLGDNTWGFEDLAGGGDNDFNDVIVKASFQVV